jgi:hypothetical protein
MPFVHVPPRIFTQIFQIQQQNMSTTSSNDFSTESAMQRHENILIVKQQCMLAEAAVQEAHVALQARMLDLQMAQKEKNKELSMRSHQEVLKAQEEVKKKEGYRQVLVDTVSQLMENQDKALTRREVSRFGPLGRVPSSMLVVNEEIQNENPWLDADAGHYFRGPPPFSRTQVAKFYKKYHWTNVFLTPGMVQCMVTGEWSSRGDQVTVSRILPKSTSKSVLTRLGLSQRDLNHSRNMLVLSHKIKKLFDRQRLSFVLHEDGMTKDVGLCFRMVVWDKTVLKKKIFKGSRLTVGDFENKMFRFYSDEHIPFLRALSLHAQQSYELAIKKRFLHASHKRPAEFGSPLLRESITCSSEEMNDEDDDLSLDSDQSVATEKMLDSIDFP